MCSFIVNEPLSQLIRRVTSRVFQLILSPEGTGWPKPLQSEWGASQSTSELIILLVATTQYSSGALQKSLNVQVCSHDSVSIVVARHSIAHLADAALDAPAALKVNRCLGIWSSYVFFPKHLFALWNFHCEVPK